jgi:hypothetical protein
MRCTTVAVAFAALVAAVPAPAQNRSEDEYTRY